MTTFPAGEKTHQAVLPQQPALESVGADTPGSRDETAHGHPATAWGTGREHGRGETDGNSTTSRRRHAVQAEIGDGDVPTQGNTYEGGTGTSRVFVLDKHGHPLMPCHPARARELLTKGRAVVARHTPFTIRVKDRTHAASEVEGVQLRIDPGSKGAWFVRSHHARPLWVPPTAAPAPQAALWLRHRRPRPRHRAHWPVDGHLVRARCRSCHRTPQRHRPDWAHRHFLQVSVVAPAGRRLFARPSQRGTKMG
ncbi:RRXRR domain-containing protein [Streptomyces sp. NPDC002133]|uniref:RRXRR domain-containing protein n=1 Tax=Streptomyces sp. NPDC002133 TaxID=3154409 RepID=UPI0033325C14